MDHQAEEKLISVLKKHDIPEDVQSAITASPLKTPRLFRKQFRTEEVLEQQAPKRYKFEDKSDDEQSFINVALSLVWEDCGILAEAEIKDMQAATDPKAEEGFAVSADSLEAALQVYAKAHNNERPAFRKTPTLGFYGIVSKTLSMNQFPVVSLSQAVASQDQHLKSVSKYQAEDKLTNHVVMKSKEHKEIRSGEQSKQALEVFITTLGLASAVCEKTRMNITQRKLDKFADALRSLYVGNTALKNIDAKFIKVLFFIAETLGDDPDISLALAIDKAVDKESLWDMKKLEVDDSNAIDHRFRGGGFDKSRPHKGKFGKGGKSGGKGKNNFDKSFGKGAKSQKHFDLYFPAFAQQPAAGQPPAKNAAKGASKVPSQQAALAAQAASSAAWANGGHY